MTVAGSTATESSVWHRVWTVQGYGLAALTVLNFFPPAHGPTRYLFFSLLLLAVVALWREGTWGRLRTAIDAPLLLLVAWILITVPFSIDPAYSFREWRKLASHVLVFYWAMGVLRATSDRGTERLVLRGVVVGTCVSAGFAIVEFLAQGGTWRDRVVRAGAVGSDYNWLSTYMVMAIPMVLTATIVVPGRWMKVAGIGTTGLAFLAELMAYTRAGWLGLVAEGFAGLWLLGRRWLLIGMVVALAAVGGVVVVLSDLGYQRETADPWTLKARVDVWKLAAADLFDHPLVGIGYGNDNFVKRYAGRPELEKADGPHSTFVVVGLGSGFPALACFIWLLLSMMLVLTRPIRRAQPISDDVGHVVPFGAAIMVVGFAVRNVFDYMMIGSLANLFWILVAVALNALRTPDRSEGGSIESLESRGRRLGNGTVPEETRKEVRK